MDLLALVAFAISAGFALTFDVGVYALARFAIRPSGSTVLRFAVQVGAAHAILLVVGAAISTGLEAALELDFVVDLLAVALLTIVVAGVARRPRVVDAEPSPSHALSWVTTFALSLDALLVAPAANGALGDADLHTRLLTLAGIMLAICGFTALYAKFASELQRRIFANSSANADRPLRIAHFAELLVFCSLWATSAAKSIEHFVDHAYSTGIWGIAGGLVLALILYLGCSEPEPEPRASDSS